MADLVFNPIPADFAIDLYEALVSARRLQLQPALSRAVSEIGVPLIDRELQQLVPEFTLNHVASLGLRGERVFPVPVIIAHSPSLIGYYRMLLGLSRKEFSQAKRLGYGPWSSAEESGRLPSRLMPFLEQFCLALIVPLVDLVKAMDVFNERDLNDISLLTLGPMLQGGRNNVIGNRAAIQMFDALRDLFRPWIIYDNDHLMRIRLAGGEEYECAAASDPDVRIDARSGAVLTPVLAIEIKGGSDASNVHNRAGEAEKSQIKARQAGYRHCWTVIMMRGANRSIIQRETPSSTLLFEADEVLNKRGPDWDRFRQMVSELLLA